MFCFLAYVASENQAIMMILIWLTVHVSPFLQFFLRNITPFFQEKPVAKEEHTDVVTMETSHDDKEEHHGTLRDKQGILPTITEEDVRDALRSLAQDPGFANEGMTDDVDSVEFNEIMETLKDCFSGQRSRSNTRKHTGESSGPGEPGFNDNDLLISLEGEKNPVFVEGSKADPSVGVKALQVMDIIQTKRRAKQIEKMV